MEIAIAVVIAIALFVLIGRLFTDPDTKLFRRIWAANKVGRFDAIDAALDELLKRYKLDKTTGLSDEAKIELVGNAGELMGKAMKFELANPNNLGQTIIPDVQGAIKRQLDKAGLTETGFENP